MQVPKRKSEERVKRDSGPVLVTQEGLNKMQDEVIGLEQKIPDMIALVEHTKSHGDFSENAAYQDAKATLRRTYNRIASLKQRIKTAVLIEKQAGDTVQIGSKVTVKSSGKQLDFEILGSQESDPAQGRISNASPLGQALLNHKKGDVVAVDLYGAVVHYKILRID